MTRADDQLGLTELIAIAIGGMIGGGIFSVLGIAVGLSGHAAPLAFGLGGLIALLAGYSYVRLALAFRSDGASFTYIEHAFPEHPNIAGVMGWTVIVGYVGTLALYAFTFGAYGADLLGMDGSSFARISLSVGVLLFFMLINLLGTKTSGITEVLIVAIKVMLLAVFGVAGMTSVQRDHLLPVFDHGAGSVFVAGAMVFVAFEGFQLITNAVCEMRHPDRDTPRSVYGAILITTLIYLMVAYVAIGNLTPSEIAASEEYALAEAAKPVLGRAGQVLIGIAALLATSSAINSTAFGASRMMAEIATDRMMPKAFSFRSRETSVPWLAIVTLTTFGLVFTMLNSLEMIAAFSSLTFLFVSIGVSVANLRLYRQTGAHRGIVVIGIAVMLITAGLLIVHLWEDSPRLLAVIASIYAAVIAAELFFSKRRLVYRPANAAQ